MAEQDEKHRVSTPSVDTGLPAVVVVGEVLWDVFDTSERLGGAPLNFAARARQLGHRVELISALGADERGHKARKAIAALCIDSRWLQTRTSLPTGTAKVRLDSSGSAEFTIERPAAWDTLELSPQDLARLSATAPGWLYYGTLFASMPTGRRVLDSLLCALGQSLKFYDLNLRPGADAPALVTALMSVADVVKLNESELERVQAFTGLPADLESFCRAASNRFGWRAVSVSRAGRGSVILANGEFAEAPAVPVTVVDTVGAGDAYAAAMLHGLCHGWSAADIAAFANGAGAAVAAQSASLPAY